MEFARIFRGVVLHLVHLELPVKSFYGHEVKRVGWEEMSLHSCGVFFQELFDGSVAVDATVVPHGDQSRLPALSASNWDPAALRRHSFSSTPVSTGS